MLVHLAACFSLWFSPSFLESCSAQAGGYQSFSVFGWVRGEARSANQRFLAGDKDWLENETVDFTSNSNLGVSSVSGKEIGWCLAQQPNGAWTWNLGDGTHRLDYLPTAERQPIADGEWHLIGFTLDIETRTAHLYHDGRNVAIYSTHGLGPWKHPSIPRFPKLEGLDTEWRVSSRAYTADAVRDLWLERMAIPVPSGLAKEPVSELKVLAWNIWHGGRRDGELEGLQKTVEVIQRSGADVVAMQETYGSGARIADALGWYFHLRSSNISVMSRYPIRTTFDLYQPFRLGGVQLELSPGQFVRVFSLWIHYLPDYGKQMREGKPTEAGLVEADNETRGSEIEDILEALEAHVRGADAIPLIVAGDFNSPSHLDWVEATRERHSDLVVPWPVSSRMASSGFADAYRVVHPDPLEKVGRTWSPRFVESWQDRIDYVYFRGAKLEALGARMLDQHENGWPSDHAAVLATFAYRLP